MSEAVFRYGPGGEEQYYKFEADWHGHEIVLMGHRQRLNDKSRGADVKIVLTKTEALKLVSEIAEAMRAQIVEQ